MNKLAKLKYLPNNFDIIEEGDHVICAVSGKKISLQNLNYWNVDEQEPYFSYVEATFKKEKKNQIIIIFSTYYVSKSIDLDFLVSFSLRSCLNVSKFPLVTFLN